MNLISTFVHNPVKVCVGVILLLMFGILSIVNMPMQLTPEVEVPTLTIETRWPGASPEEVEKQIVHEQEEFLKSVEGVRKMTSASMASVVCVTLEFPVRTDMREALLKATRFDWSRISPAALSVKVSARISSGRRTSPRSLRNRMASRRVFPEPAGASTW